MDATRRIAEWVSNVTYADLSPRAVGEAKNQILSVLAAVYAGYGTASGQSVLRTVRQWPYREEATLIPSGERTSVYNAIYGNAALSMALDYDDYLFAGHTGHSAVLVTLALAEKLGKNGKDFLLAQILANEVEGRVGASVLIGPLNGQLWTFIHLVGGALIAGKLMGLDRNTLQSAVGIALLQPNFGLWAGFFGSEAKTLMASMTATAGVQGAELAAQGLRGCEDILENPQGFVKVFSREPLMGAYDGLGTVWLTETLCYKLYPGCAYIDTLVDCMLRLVRDDPIHPERVQSIDIAAGPLTLGMEALSAPHVKGPDSSHVALNFSVPYNAAVALIDRELTPRQFRPERIRDPQVWDLARKVRLSYDEHWGQRMRESSLVKPGDGGSGYCLDLGDRDLSTFRMSFGARVRIALRDGTILEAEEEVPLGGAGRPAEEKRRMVEEKFRRETGRLLSERQIAQVLEIIYHFEEASSADISELTRLLGTTNGG